MIVKDLRYLKLRLRTNFHYNDLLEWKDYRFWRDGSAICVATRGLRVIFRSKSYKTTVAQVIQWLDEGGDPATRPLPRRRTQQPIGQLALM